MNTERTNKERIITLFNTGKIEVLKRIGWLTEKIQLFLKCCPCVPLVVFMLSESQYANCLTKTRFAFLQLNINPL